MICFNTVPPKILVDDYQFIPHSKYGDMKTEARKESTQAADGAVR
jgi:hypothetical protein